MPTKIDEIRERAKTTRTGRFVLFSGLKAIEDRDTLLNRIDELERDRRKFHRRSQKAEGALAQIQNWADICRDRKPSTDVPLDQIDAILEDTDNERD